MSAPGKRRGPRGAGQDTRAALLAAAREVFAERGFDAATVRMIADRCAVDPAMVNHWFGGKQGLFHAAVELPAASARAATLTAGDGVPESLAERIVHMFVTACDTAGGGEFAALVRSVGSQALAVSLLSEFVHNIVRPIAAPLPLDLLELRITLCCSHMMGLGMARYVLGMEPLASAHPKAVVRMIAPGLQHYLSPLFRV